MFLPVAEVARVGKTLLNQSFNSFSVCFAGDSFSLELHFAILLSNMLHFEPPFLVHQEIINKLQRADFLLVLFILKDRFSLAGISFFAASQVHFFT